MAALGATVEKQGHDTVRHHHRRRRRAGQQPTASTLDCGNSGSTMRMLSGLDRAASTGTYHASSETTRSPSGRWSASASRSPQMGAEDRPDRRPRADHHSRWPAHRHRLRYADPLERAGEDRSPLRGPASAKERQASPNPSARATTPSTRSQCLRGDALSDAR